MAETDSIGKSIREYVYNTDHVLVGLKTNGTWYNDQSNSRGDIVAIADLDGKVAAEYTCDSLNNQSQSNNTFLCINGVVKNVNMFRGHSGRAIGILIHM